jgi:hypothetical protein
LLTPHPHGCAMNMYGSNIGEWRNSYVLSLYAAESIKIARSLGIHYLDIFSAANAVHDLTYDGAHMVYRRIAKTSILWTYLYSTCHSAL